jgi:hypothetical protein
VRGISDLVTVHGLINLDFADVRTIMSEMGMAIMGCRVGASDRPVRRVGRVVDEGGEPRIQACEDDANVPDGPAEFTIDPLSDEDAEHDYESPAFLRRAK